MTDEAVPAPDSAAQPAPAKTSADKAHGRLNAAAVILLVFGGISVLNTLAVMLWAVLGAAFRAGRQGTLMLQNGGGFPNDGRFGGGPAGGMPTVIGAPAGDWHALGFAFLAILIIGAAGAIIGGSQILAGFWILQRRTWGRVLGMVVSGMALIVLVTGFTATLVWAGAVAGPAMQESGRHFAEHARSAFTAVIGFGAIVWLILTAAYGWILFTLARHDEAFEPIGGPQPTA